MHYYRISLNRRRKKKTNKPHSGKATADRM